MRWVVGRRIFGGLVQQGAKKNCYSLPSGTENEKLDPADVEKQANQKLWSVNFF